MNSPDKKTLAGQRRIVAKVDELMTLWTNWKPNSPPPNQKAEISWKPSSTKPWPILKEKIEMRISRIQ